MICNHDNSVRFRAEAQNLYVMTIFWCYYVICIAYCFFQVSKSWRKNGLEGGLGITPGMDSIMILLLGWVLAPIDFFLTFTRLYSEAEKVRREKNSIEKTKE